VTIALTYYLVTWHIDRVLTTLENVENSGNFLILENSRNFKFTQKLFVVNLAPVSVALDITSTQQKFVHLVEALYEAHCLFQLKTADSAKVQFSRHAS